MLNVGKRFASLVPLLVLLIPATWFWQQGFDTDLDSIRQQVDSWGMWGPWLLILLVACRPFLMLPSQLFFVIAGICFGPVAGALYGALGMLISAAMWFGVSRYCRDSHWFSRAQTKLPNSLQSLPALQQRPYLLSGLILMATAYPVGPANLYHTAAGLTRLPWLLFLFAVLVGAFIRGLTFTLFGEALLASGQTTWVAALALLLVVVCLPLLLTPSRRWLLAYLKDR